MAWPGFKILDVLCDSGDFKLGVAVPDMPVAVPFSPLILLPRPDDIVFLISLLASPFTLEFRAF